MLSPLCQGGMSHTALGKEGGKDIPLSHRHPDGVMLAEMISSMSALFLQVPSFFNGENAAKILLQNACPYSMFRHKNMAMIFFSCFAKLVFSH